MYIVRRILYTKFIFLLALGEWIKKQNPSFSELEVTLEFVRMSHEADKMEEWQWVHFQSIMASKIRRGWAQRFRAMTKAKNLVYNDLEK